MTVPIRNHDIAELRRLDLAHHLPAQTDYRLQETLGGSRIPHAVCSTPAQSQCRFASQTRSVSPIGPPGC
jgi:hypothetical protein